MSLARRVLAFFRGESPAAGAGLVDPSAPLVVAVSGGPDSLALLHLLAQAGLHPAGYIVAAHLDHGLRLGSAADAAWVQETAARWGVACHTRRVDVAALSLREKLSVEEAARRARYHFLAEVAGQEGAPVIITAHTADDQAETVLMHLLRGSGLSGLRGMLPAAPVPGAPHLTLLRPLLTTTRAEILDHCAAQGLRPLEDESNADPAFFRNRVRHELLPLLAGYSPAIKERLQSLAAISAADYELLSYLAAQARAGLEVGAGAGWTALDRPKWLALPLSLRRATLRLALEPLLPPAGELGFRALEQARAVAEAGPVGAESVLPSGMVLSVGYGRLYLATGPLPLDEWPQLASAAALPLAVPGALPLAAGWRLEATFLDNIGAAAVAGTADPLQAFLDARLAGALVVRPRQPSERFRPLGMAGATAAVKEVMINRKIPAAARPLWPLVATADHLAWLPGDRIDERARLTPESEGAVSLRIFRPE
jgi:tRNA(Ile)-lysidine synthase